MKEEFFYNDAASKITYKNSPTSELDVSRMLKNKPYWKFFSNSLIKKKKTIIVNRCLLNNLNEYDREIIRLRLFKMQKNGFKVYVVDHKELTELSIYNWMRLFMSAHAVANNECVPAEKDILNDAIQKLELTADKVFILNNNSLVNFFDNGDDDWLDQAPFENIDLKDTPITELSLRRLLAQKGSSIKSLETNKLILLEKSFLKNNNPPVSHDIENSLSLQNLSKFVFNGRDLEKQKCEKLISDILSSAGEKLEELFLANCCVQQSQVINLNKLKKLSLKYCNFDEKDTLDFINTDSLSLEFFDVDGGQNIPLELIKKCLKEKNSVKTCKLSIEDLKLEIVQLLDFESVEELSINSSMMSYAVLNNILSKCTNLKSLELYDLTMDEQFQGFEWNGFQNLEKFRVSSFKGDRNFLTAIIKKSPNIKTLDFSYVNFTNISLEACNFSSLFDSEATNITFDWLKDDKKSFPVIFNMKNNQPKDLYVVAGFGEEDYVENFSSVENLIWRMGAETKGNEGLKTLVPKLFNLKTIVVKVRPANGSFFVDHLRQLKDLNLKGVVLTIDYRLYELTQAQIDGLKKTIKELKESIQVVNYQTYESLDQVQAFNLNKNNNEDFKPLQVNRESSTLDADTTFDENMQFNVTKVFYASDKNADPNVNDYRLSVYNSIEYTKGSCDIQHAFCLKNSSADKMLVNRNPIEKAEKDLYHEFKTSLSTASSYSAFYYGKQDLLLTNEWQSLASLSAHEVLKKYHIDPPTELEIKYSSRDSLYYIRLQPSFAPETNVNYSAEKKVTIDFLLEVYPMTTVASLAASGYDNVFVQPFKHCSGFSRGDLKFDQKLDGLGYLRALYEQKLGACRHRSLVFKALLLAQGFPENSVRIINNECHSFAEVFFRNTWMKSDFGGYPAKLITNEHNNPAEKIPNPIISDLTETGAVISGRKNEYFPIPKKTTPTFVETKVYMEHITSSSAKNTRIKLESDNIPGFRYHLEDYCERTKKPCYYIDSAEELVCMALYLERNLDENTGFIKKGPAGPLYNFLKENEKNKSFLIVNYSKFSASEIASYNALLDKHEADGVRIPELTKVIGLFDPNKPGAYEGQDFASRFEIDLECTLSSTQLAVPEVVKQQATAKETATNTLKIIELYGGADWVERLLGRWIMNGENLLFVDGELLELVTKNNNNNQITHLQLNNAPWEDESFQRFWQDAMRTKKFKCEGKEYNLPNGLVLTKKSGYEISDVDIAFNKINKIPEDAVVLNPGTLFKFFGDYICNASNMTIQYGDGIINKVAKNTNVNNKKINFYVTDDLDINSWAKIIDACKKSNIKICLTLVPGVKLPLELKIAVPENILETRGWIANEPETGADGKSNQSGAIVIDVSEVDASQLLMGLNSQFDNENKKFKFTEEKGFLISALKEGKTVVLKGKLKDDTRYALTEFLLERQRESSPKGILILRDDFVKEPHFNAEGWKGLESLPPIKTIGNINLTDPAAETKAFNAARTKLVKSVLDKSPFVFLAGMTGVGKTTFVQKVWSKQKGYELLYEGKSSVLKWAKDRTTGVKTLFIDEANISSRQWSEFEGLFNTPPGILINNEYIELTPEHKVIFAGNPLSYGGERQIPSLFKRHGHAVIFEPMTPGYIYHEILEPILKDFGGIETAKPILEIAQCLTQYSENEVLLTAREIGMMALLTVSYCENNKNTSPKPDSKTVAKYYAYQLSHGFVPEKFKTDFEQKFKLSNSFNVSNNLKKHQDFVNTQSNQAAFNALSDFMSLHQLRLNGKIQSESGLGGLILEGEPGIGKTDMVFKTLSANNIKFYDMPMSMPISKKETLLLKAFKEGAVVVIDEINSGPMLEELLNALLMGKTPEGKTAVELGGKPGFMVIGTQNPVTMAGRSRATKALEHRMQKVIMPEYTDLDMKQILLQRGVEEEIVSHMLHDYKVRRLAALKDPSIPSVCFRDLIKLAENIVKSENRSENTLNTGNKAADPILTLFNSKTATEKLDSNNNNNNNKPNNF